MRCGTESVGRTPLHDGAKNEKTTFCCICDKRLSRPVHLVTLPAHHAFVGCAPAGISKLSPFSIFWRFEFKDDLSCAGMNRPNTSPQDPEPPDLRPGEGLVFATTRWSLILRTREPGDDGHAALEALCLAYWLPLRSYLLRAGHHHADAEDFTQEFFAGLLRRGSLAKLVPERGRFRNFLLVSLRHFLADERDKARAARRGGGVVPLSLHAEAADGQPQFDVPDTLTPEQIFERQWAETLLARARERLREECVASGRMAIYEALGPEGNDADETYVQMGPRLGLTEEGVKSAAFRLRRRYRELIRAEVADTVSSESDLEDELRHLLTVLSS
jgi:RNA polymerase sigma factor (sigma-70 family)